jgi:phosphoribosylformylglycinamidine (FGAM) synthase PurS component
MKPGNLTEITKTAAAVAASNLTAKLRAQALSQGWPSEAAKGVRVVFSGKSFEIKISSSAEDLVQTLEYGTEDTPPNPVIRSFSLRSQKIEQEFVTEWQRRAGWVA